MRAAWLFAALVLATGCNQILGIEKTTFGDAGVADGDAAIDEAPDANVPPATCAAPDSKVCDDRGHVVTCADGQVVEDIPCPLGCASDGTASCAAMQVTNGLTRFLADAAGGPDMVFPNGTSYLFASEGQVTINNEAVSVPSEVVGALRVFAFHSLKIDGQLLTHRGYEERGGPAIVLVVAGDVEITGLVDVSADRWQWGPGALDEEASRVAGCLGGEGGKDNLLASLKGGGGGAGGYHEGAPGGASPTFPGGGAGAAKFGDALSPLHGGCTGGEAGSGGYSGMGGAGGAIQISSATRIVITDVGAIDASGGGGAMVPSYAGMAGGGGGGGGAILLEAPEIVLRGGDVVLSTKGGGGGGTGENIDGTDRAIGEDGGLSAEPAQGGFFSDAYLRGGNGGTADVAPTAGPSSTTGHGAGGGGSVGQVQFITRDGTVTIDGGAAVRSPYTTSAITLRASR